MDSLRRSAAKEEVLLHVQIPSMHANRVPCTTALVCMCRSWLLMHTPPLRTRSRISWVPHTYGGYSTYIILGTSYLYKPCTRAQYFLHECDPKRQGWKMKDSESSTANAIGHHGEVLLYDLYGAHTVLSLFSSPIPATLDP